jgi:hypothetical protein
VTKQSRTVRLHWIASRSLSSGRPLRAGPVGSQRRQAKSFPRHAPRPGFANHQARKKFAALPHRTREAERRKAHQPCPRMHRQTLPPADAGRGSGRNRRPLAFRRFATVLARASERSSSAQAVLHAIDKQRGRYPRRQSRLSGAPRAPVVVPAGTKPGPPENGVTSPVRRNRTRSWSGVSRDHVPYERDSPAHSI